VGVEKVVIGTAAVELPELVAEAAREFGNQSVVVCLDVKKSPAGRYDLHTQGGRRSANLDPVAFARRMEGEGAGELIVSSIDRDGTQTGYDLELTRAVTAAVRVPVIASGGAGRLDDFQLAVQEGGASAAAAGSLFVFHGKLRAVLISYPTPADLRAVFDTRGGEG
jgi:cyclase